MKKMSMLLCISSVLMSSQDQVRQYLKWSEMPKSETMAFLETLEEEPSEFRIVLDEIEEACDRYGCQPSLKSNSVHKILPRSHSAYRYCIVCDVWFLYCDQEGRHKKRKIDLCDGFPKK